MKQFQPLFFQKELVPGIHSIRNEFLFNNELLFKILKLHLSYLYHKHVSIILTYKLYTNTVGKTQKLFLQIIETLIIK